MSQTDRSVAGSTSQAEGPIAPPAITAKVAQEAAPVAKPEVAGTVTPDQMAKLRLAVSRFSRAMAGVVTDIAPPAAISTEGADEQTTKAVVDDSEQKASSKVESPVSSVADQDTEKHSKPEPEQEQESRAPTEAPVQQSPEVTVTVQEVPAQTVAAVDADVEDTVVAEGEEEKVAAPEHMPKVARQTTNGLFARTISDKNDGQPAEQLSGTESPKGSQ